MVNVTEDIIKFSYFLDMSWEAAQFFLNTGNSPINFAEEDWLQSNWETLVENKICLPGQFLQVYGDGADCYDGYSRITFYDKSATHKIIGNLLKSSVFDLYNKVWIDNLKDFTFHNFLNLENDIGSFKVPFDIVEFEHDYMEKTIWINKNEVNYFMVPLI